MEWPYLTLVPKTGKVLRFTLRKMDEPYNPGFAWETSAHPSCVPIRKPERPGYIVLGITNNVCGYPCSFCGKIEDLEDTC